MYQTLKVVVLPHIRNNNNPYLDQLSENLTTLGVRVESAQYSSFFLLDVVRKWRADVLHLQWLHSFLVKSTLFKSAVSTFLFISQLIVLKILGVRIVWTVHNLKNHNNKYLAIDQIGTAAVARLSDSIIAHCESAKHEIVNEFNLRHSNKVSVIFHGNYINCYENNLEKLKARELLNINESKLVLLFFGLIRPYKGIVELIEAFEQLKYDDLELLIVGKVWEDSLHLAELIQQKSEVNDSITFIPGFVDDNDIQIYMNACDAVIFPYRDILTSGAVQLAISFGRACIAPRIGCIGETLDDQGALLYDSVHDAGLLQAMKDAYIRRDRLSKMGKHNYELSEQFSWKRVAELTLKVYQASSNIR